jgi:signal peptidase I
LDYITKDNKGKKKFLIIAEKIMNDLFFYETTGYSMWPFIRPGRKLIVKKIPVENLRAGDIILYRSDDQLICHRLIKKVKDKQKYFLYARGDNSSSSPEVIREGAYSGKAVGILKNNKILSLTSWEASFFNAAIILIGPRVGWFARIIRPLYVRSIKKPLKK